MSSSNRSGRNRPESGLRAVPDRPAATLREQGFSLGDWTVEPRRNRLVGPGGEERKLDPRLIDVLIELACRPGEVFSRDQLLESVWKDVFVSENTLSQAISRLRRALGDDRNAPRYIETISKSGYRLVAEVAWPDPAGPLHAVPAETAGTHRADHPAATATPARRFPVAAYTIAGAALIAVAFATWFMLPREIATSPLPVHPESTLVGTQFEPYLSPDGSTLAFAWQGPAQDNWDIWVHPIEGDAPVRLTDDPATERLPAWSPDGKSVAFVRFDPAGGQCGIFRRAILGGATERLADCVRGMRSLTWSPDGSTLCLTGADAPDEPRGLRLLQLDSGEVTLLTTPPEGSRGDDDPAFSPDGRWIAFERHQSRHRHDLMVVPVSGGEPRPLTDDAWGQLRGLDWTADGKAVVIASNRSGRFLLWRVPLAGGELERLPIEDDWVTQPSLSRSGGLLTYRTFRDEVDVWAYPVSGTAGAPTRRVPSTRSEREAAWSPDGRSIAFISDRSGTVELWSSAPDGGGARRHTDLAGPLPASPAWSADGERIVYDAAVFGHSDLWEVPRDGRRPVRLTDHPAEDRNASFSRDGRRLYFASDRSGSWQIWRRSVDGGEAEVLTRDGGFLAQESPDGRELFFVKLDEPGIWRMPSSGGDAERLPLDLDLGDWGGWTATDEGIYFVMRRPKSVGYFAFADGQVQTVFETEKTVPYLSRTLSLSADGDTLLVSIIDRSDDEVMRVHDPEGVRF
ncbi:hypothetical protein ABI59_09520 [Acidobacteria bacterium Mor1]|nr:hypothetical protein ABI59_09520 [Acidobacteria bacterium Mor1]